MSRLPSLRAPLALCAVLGLVGCDDEPEPTDAGLDAAAADAGVDAGPSRSALCDELGLPVRAFDSSATSAGFEQLAGDFTVQTTEGPWSLSERWSGCESYVFVSYSGDSYGQGLFASVPDDIFSLGPRNVHYFFGSHEADEAAVTARTEAMRVLVEEGFEFVAMPEADRVFWRSHIHYLTQPLRDSAGSVGELVRGSSIVMNAFAITRQQRFDPVGSLFAVGSAGFVPRLSMARFAAPFYDYMHDLDARIAADTEATVVSLLDDETTSSRVIDRAVTLPDATAMAAFDTLEVDVELTCHLSPDGCSEWDRIAYVMLCEDDACADTRELVRWITPYSRPGRRRWLMDATPLLGLLREGGARTFRMVFGPDWEEATERVVSVDLRLSTRGVADTAIGAELAFRGGAFNAEYNTGRVPFVFTPPAGTTRVELAVIVSGHGMDAGNCAEWCDHVHTFTANGGAAQVIDYPTGIGDPLGCAELSGAGVPPGQWGNWAPMRAGWCPGYPVPTHRIDITSDLDLGAENELTYRGSYAGAEPAGGTIDLSAYVVYYR